jgi:hypothetical protein
MVTSIWVPSHGLIKYCFHFLINILGCWTRKTKTVNNIALPFCSILFRIALGMRICFALLNIWFLSLLRFCQIFRQYNEFNTSTYIYIKTMEKSTCFIHIKNNWLKINNWVIWQVWIRCYMAVLGPYCVGPVFGCHVGKGGKFHVPCIGIYMFICDGCQGTNGDGIIL